MNRKFVGVAAAVLLASIGTLTLLGWAKSAEDRALAGERTLNVLVVMQDIAKGTRAEDLGTQVEMKRVPAKVKAAGSVDNVADLKGKVAAIDLVPGEQVVSTRFVEPEVLARQTGAEVPDGLQEVTIKLEPQRAVGGNLRPGDTVGLVASFEPFEDGSGAKSPNETHLMLHKVLVTRVQAAPTTASRGSGDDDEDRGPEPVPGSDLLVTLAVDAPSVERIVFAQEFGRVWLTAEPETATEDGTTIQHRGTVYNK
ncbi:MAG: Flp pilus assembly protein CpaB [Actinobacteria bacterium]|nr:Flp pilus assembly protein CpaB [Actinomycetota bacterium]